ncbi:MAG: thiamine-phosphate pyrophosphorylase [Planctomycetota bacterium]|jgi:thiamine-phosphate pyrophosphorylase
MPTFTSPRGNQLRARLANAHIMLVFTPALCLDRDPCGLLADVLEFVDVVQVRPKVIGGDSVHEPTSARDAMDWCKRVLEVIAARPALDVPVIVNDRVDVAKALEQEGIAGVHLGQSDSPVSVARELLGPDALIGLSTTNAHQVAGAIDESVDYLGFGPTFATSTKGYPEGRGAEAAWVANNAATVPLFAIGGIDESNIDQLSAVRRVAVSSALLSAPNPRAAAERLRGLLLES